MRYDSTHPSLPLVRDVAAVDRALAALADFESALAPLATPADRGGEPVFSSYLAGNPPRLRKLLELLRVESERAGKILAPGDEVMVWDANRGVERHVFVRAARTKVYLTPVGGSGREEAYGLADGVRDNTWRHGKISSADLYRIWRDHAPKYAAGAGTRALVVEEPPKGR